jgi:KUP system potassium uptake protein
MVTWRKKLFVAIAHNAADPASRFMLPPQQTVTMGNDVQI